jgi:CRISPR/Cas system CSM-associated protein Csm4 (group 5 of RAMP superfamily)
VPKFSLLPCQIAAELDFIQEKSKNLIEAIKKVYLNECCLKNFYMLDDINSASGRSLKGIQYLTEKSHEEIITEFKRKQEETRRLEAERIEKERIEEEKRKEQARLEKEVKIAAEKAQMEEFQRNAPEVAMKLIQDLKTRKEEQEALKE